MHVRRVGWGTRPTYPCLLIRLPAPLQQTMHQTRSNSSEHTQSRIGLRTYRYPSGGGQQSTWNYNKHRYVQREQAGSSHLNSFSTMSCGSSSSSPAPPPPLARIRVPAGSQSAPSPVQSLRSTRSRTAAAAAAGLQHPGSKSKIIAIIIMRMSNTRQERPPPPVRSSEHRYACIQRKVGIIC